MSDPAHLNKILQQASDSHTTTSHYTSLNAVEKYIALQHAISTHTFSKEILIGQGAEGSVWQVNEDWAKKVGNPNTLKKELRNWLKLYGEYSAYLEGNSLYFRYIDGKKLTAVIKQEPGIKKLRGRINQVLGYINQKGLVYNDLHPSNFIYSPTEDQVYAIDLSEIYPGNKSQSLSTSQFKFWKTLSMLSS